MVEFFRKLLSREDQGDIVGTVTFYNGEIFEETGKTEHADPEAVKLCYEAALAEMGYDRKDKCPVIVRANGTVQVMNWMRGDEEE